MNGNAIIKSDFHMHSTISDGTDTPSELLVKVKEAGIALFAVTDHDAVKGCIGMKEAAREAGLRFVPGIEFSCKDSMGKYHILGYGYEITAPAINRAVSRSHSMRIEKVQARLEFLKDRYGFTFSDASIRQLFALNNPGKPHIANMMVEYGYASSKEEAITDYINGLHFASKYLRPEEAITAILESGGIPVLAHPSFGSGDQLVMGEEMDARLRHLTEYGLQGVEAYYSGFSGRLIRENLDFAHKFDLYVSAGSDYHGRNKLILLGDTNLPDGDDADPAYRRFEEEILSLTED